MDRDDHVDLRELEQLARAPLTRMASFDLREPAQRRDAIALVVALIDTFIRPNVDAATEDYEDDDPPGGYHFVPERWFAQDEDDAGDVLGELGRAGFSLLDPPSNAEILHAIRDVQGSLRGPADEVAPMLYRSWVGESGQLAAESLLARLSDERVQQPDSPRSREEFAALVGLVSDELPRKLIWLLVAALFGLSPQLGRAFARQPHGPLVSWALRAWVAADEDG